MGTYVMGAIGSGCPVLGIVSLQLWVLNAEYNTRIIM